MVNVTLDEVRVVGLVRRQHGRHFVVVRRVDVLVDAVPGQLYLWRRALVSSLLPCGLFDHELGLQ